VKVKKKYPVQSISKYQLTGTHFNLALIPQTDEFAMQFYELSSVQSVSEL